MSKFSIIPGKLLEDFLALVRIDSPSRNERGVADWLIKELTDAGCEVEEDDAGGATGGNAGNLFVRFAGNRPDAKTLMFSSHMDTVIPADGVEPIVEDGIVRSKGETILGADDKAGLAVILHLVRMAEAQPEIPRPDLEISLHVCEEIGLLGAKHVDISKFRAVAGFILDDHEPKEVTIGSPSAVRVDYKIIGRAVHAGIEPEKGISALEIASKAISNMNLGRIDAETTANIGVVKGGGATNIVMEEIEMKAEARSHSIDRLEEQVKHMQDCFEAACEERRKEGEDVPRFVQERKDDYKAVRFNEDDFPVRLVKAAGAKLGWTIKTKIGGGGTDGSIITHKGIPSIVVGVGMQDVHSTKEWIRISDLENAARIVGSIVVTHASENV
ncbi:MAG: M20/M25/M40 family metallo-hydrolase [Candidatus Electryonea clarkiae]|nr:M20/M25/M40 family metallo-hydrolase [Candidatus Electryonea clarkiae]MDP8289212.1 M20/M25/M40 family metallo-hydrolase [Candidatus Electryonea clarkiae]